MEKRPKTDSPVKCTSCNMDCRSGKCYENHKKVPLHKKGPKKGQPSGPTQCKKWWTCYKVVRNDKRKKEEHECSSCYKYVMDDHQCNLRSTPPKEGFIPKFIFFDFECSQDERVECEEVYTPLKKD